MTEDKNGSHVTRSEMYAEVRALRWELRFWMIGAIGVGTVAGVGPQQVVGVIASLF